MTEDDAGRRGEADAVPIVGARRMEALERNEELVHERGVEADAVVLDEVDTRSILVARTEADPGLGSSARELPGVPDEALEQDAEEARIAVGEDPVLDPDQEPTLALFDEYARNMERLIAVNLTPTDREEVLAKLVNPDTTRGKNAAHRIAYLADYGRGNAAYRGTAYALFHGATDYVDHERTPGANADRRFESMQRNVRE